MNWMRGRPLEDVVATRAYNSTARLRQQAERKARIAAYTAELHAAKGVAATSYADIAAKAGVSLPTVYSHYPTQNDLLQGCTGHVVARAPQLPVASIFSAASLAAAADRLVSAIEKQHLHFEPWLSRREDGVIPFLAEMSAGMRRSQAELVAQLLERHLGPGRRTELVAGWESVLSFDLWFRLLRGHRLPRSAVRRILIQCLLALAEGQPTSQPRSKSP